MGYGLPAAIAASIAYPDRAVVAIAGDGGFAMTMGELETAVREGARPVAVVLDNACYGTIRVGQERDGLAPTAVDLGAVDFAAAARALGAVGYTVTTDEAFEPALRDALASGRPAVIHVALDRAWASVDQHP
jgi:acetolactate synthase-1/2/3 large subunit